MPRVQHAACGRNFVPKRRSEFAPVVRELAVARAGHQCEWCDACDVLRLNHFVPLVRGGDLQIDHAACALLAISPLGASAGDAHLRAEGRLYVRRLLRQLSGSDVCMATTRDGSFEPRLLRLFVPLLAA